MRGDAHRGGLKPVRVAFVSPRHDSLPPVSSGAGQVARRVETRGHVEGEVGAAVGDAGAGIGTAVMPIVRRKTPPA